jgi:uncharacterized protein YdeI (YjbR/CyaY-like superfamily)
MPKATTSASRPRFFRSAVELRNWLAKHHDKQTELWIGFYRKDSGRTGLNYSEALDEALCFGWIDGVRKKVDELSYTNRFTPRKARSVWSNVNIRRVQALTEAGRMMPSGLAIFEKRDPARGDPYSYAKAAPNLSPEFDRILRANKTASAFFDSLPPWVRRTSVTWVMSAKQDATRSKRLAKLIDCCHRGRRIPLLASSEKKKSAAAATRPSKVGRRVFG